MELFVHACHVPNEVVFLICTILAKRAVEGLFPSVGLDMGLEVLLVHRPVRAERTRERLLPAMYLNMLLQVAVTGGAEGAVGAVQGGDCLHYCRVVHVSRVDVRMNQQQGGL